MSLIPPFRPSSGPFSSAEKMDAKLKADIEQARQSDTFTLKRDTSQYLTPQGSGKLYQPKPNDSQFHHRDPAMNQLPLFYSAIDTEIAAPAAIQTLPPMQRALASIRLIAKRFINADTGLSLEGSGKKGNPTLHEQRFSFRAARGEAATATIANYRGKYIQDLYDHVLKQIDFSNAMDKPVTVHLVRPGRDLLAADATINFLSLAAQAEVTDSLNYLAKIHKVTEKIRFSDERSLPVLSRTARSNASPLGRIVQQGFYDPSGFHSGDWVVIVDDHSQAGATILSMASALREKGAHVLAAITPTVHPFSKNLMMSPAVKHQLHSTLQEWDPHHQLAQKLKSYGMPLETLTNHEAMIIIAYATEPKNRVQRKAFERLEHALLDQNAVLDGDSDSLKPVLAQKPHPVDALLLEMDQELEKNRKVTAPQSREAVYVLDWDDFLRDEKGLNYRLMHNAVAKAAQAHGQKYPFLVRLNQALAAKRGQYQANQGMPLLSMTADQFQSATIGNTQFLKRDAIDDLLSHLDGLTPGLQQEFEAQRIPLDVPGQTQKNITNILWHTFRREYQAAIQQNAKPSTEEQPFTNPQPQFLPGARNFLKSLHRPENFVSLISNRPHADLEKEVSIMELSHYFDDVQGTLDRLTETNGKITLKDPRFKKPNPHRLQVLLEKNPALKQSPQWHFWGDSPKDISQAVGFLQKQPMLRERQISGTLVNPNPLLLGPLQAQLEAANLSDVIRLTQKATLESALETPPNEF